MNNTATAKLKYRKIAPNTYEVIDAEGPAAIVQRDRGAESWSGFTLKGRKTLVDQYPGSRETAARNACRLARELDAAAEAPAAPTVVVEFLEANLCPAGGEFAVHIVGHGDVWRTMNPALGKKVVAHINNVPTFSLEGPADINKLSSDIVTMVLLQARQERIAEICAANGHHVAPVA